MESLLATDLVNEISTLLANMKLNEALYAMNDNKYNECLKNNSWDLIPVITGYLSEDNKLTDLYNCCEQLLLIIAEKSNPEEALLEFIEQAELAKSDTQFLSILNALKKVLMKLVSKRGHSLEWTLNTIQDRLTRKPLPGEMAFEREEKLLCDTDSKVSSITLLYSEVLPFYEHFINEVSLPKHNLKEHRQRRILLASFMLQLLGKPLAALDLECDARTKSRARLCAEKIMLYLSELVSNPFLFLQYVEERTERTSKIQVGPEDDPVQDIYSCENKTPTLSLGVYFYLLLSENVQPRPIPTVYDTLYIFRTVLHLATHLLKQPEEYIARKGILLAHALICSEAIKVLPHTLLDSDVHSDFCMFLTTAMMYSDIKEYRELCMKVFKTYLVKFDLQGKYCVILHLMKHVKHMNMRGFLVTQYKDIIRHVMSTDENKISEFFSGRKLHNILNVFCALTEGPETDLIEHGDQIISTLNLLIYLAIRDKYNVTGVWNHFKTLERIFFEPLKKGLILSKAHYEQKIKQLHNEKGQGDMKTNVRVGMEYLPNMSFEDKLSVLEYSMNSFAALEMLLARVEELVAEGPIVNIE